MSVARDPQLVAEMRRRRTAGEKLTDIAAALKCSPALVCSVTRDIKIDPEIRRAIRSAATIATWGKRSDRNPERFTPEHHAWVAMIYRCTNKDGEAWADYGGRGIMVCDRWRTSYLSFLEDMGRRPSAKHSLDRFPDHNGNYEPSNCRWATWTSGGTVALTTEGDARANFAGVPTTTAELHEAIRSKLPPAKWKILDALIAVYPKALSKDDLAAQIDVSATSGGYFNNLGSLRSLGLVDYPQPGAVAALPVLFLEGR